MRRLKVEVSNATSFLLGAALGKDKVRMLAADWVEENPFKAAEAWAERHPDDASEAWASGGDAVKEKIKAWVEEYPDEVAFAWAIIKKEDFSLALKDVDIDARADCAWYVKEDVENVGSGIWYEPEDDAGRPIWYTTN